MLPDEIEKCRLVVVWGMNVAHSSPHGFEMLKRMKKKGAKIYVIDPIRTETAELGVHLQIKPTTDAALALGCINHIIENRLHLEEYIKLNTTGFDKLKEVCKKYDMNAISRLTGLKTREIEDFIADYVSLRPNCIMIGYGMQRNRNGGEMVRAISMLPALIGQTRGFFYSTDIDDFDRDYLEGTAITSRQKVRYNMVDLGRSLESERIKMMFVYDSNPLATLPNQTLVRKGFARDDLFTVVHDLFMTDTADYADIVLPATSFFEHFDINASYFHQYVSLNEKAIEPLGEAKSNTDLFRALASEMKPPPEGAVRGRREGREHAPVEEQGRRGEVRGPEEEGLPEDQGAEQGGLPDAVQEDRVLLRQGRRGGAWRAAGPCRGLRQAPVPAHLVGAQDADTLPVPSALARGRRARGVHEPGGHQGRGGRGRVDGHAGQRVRRAGRSRRSPPTRSRGASS